MLSFIPIAETACQIGESPTWDAVSSALLWCDIPTGKIFELKLDDGEIGAGARRSWSFDGPVGSFGLAQDGRLIVACGRSLLWLDRDTGAVNLCAQVEPDASSTRLNDGKVGPDGAFWVGSMDDTPAKQPIGALYRVTSAGAVEQKASGFVTSNGLAWAADGRVMFHADSRGPTIDSWRFDPTSGVIGGRTRLATLSEAEGRPDGGATDKAGIYWSAGVSAGRLNLFDIAGVPRGSHLFPVPAPTMPCFGGMDLKTLFVTSLRRSTAGPTSAPDSLSGSIFYTRVETAGVPIHVFDA